MTTKISKKAKLAAAMAYAPYSNFKVGAAVELDNGEIVAGCNIENAAYGLSMCAERVAIYRAFYEFPDAKITRIAITSISTSEIISPCGACRQVIAEFAKKQNKDIEIIMFADNKHKSSMISKLLPDSFTL